MQSGFLLVFKADANIFKLSMGIIRLNHSTVQHDPINRRIYVMKLDGRDVPSILPSLAQLARDKGYEKILVKTPRRQQNVFPQAGCEQEARIPCYFKDREDPVKTMRYKNTLQVDNETPKGCSRNPR